MKLPFGVKTPISMMKDWEVKDELKNLPSHQIDGEEFKIIKDVNRYVELCTSPNSPYNYRDTYSATKVNPVMIRASIPGQQLPVYSQDGILEAYETEAAGSYVLCKADKEGNPIEDELGRRNEWQISEETLREKYNCPEYIDDYSIIEPISTPQKFLRLQENVTIKVPWGPNGEMIDQNIAANGVLNITNPKDIYGISARDFDDTYTLTKESRRSPEDETFFQVGLYKGYCPDESYDPRRKPTKEMWDEYEAEKAAKAAEFKSADAERTAQNTESPVVSQTKATPTRLSVDTSLVSDNSPQMDSPQFG